MWNVRKSHCGWGRWRCLTITTDAPRIIKIMVVVIKCIKTSKLPSSCLPGDFTHGDGDAPAGLWALCPGRSRSWSRRAAPGSPSLQTGRSPSVPPLHTASRSLSPHCALSIQVSPGSIGCGCSSLQEGSPLLMTNAKVSRSSRRLTISIPV